MIASFARIGLIVGAMSTLCITPTFASSSKGGAKAPKAAKAAAKGAVDTKDMEKAQETFPAFCELWMGKLAAREQENRLRRDFKANGAGFNTTFVGYSQEHDCTVSTDGKVPIGRVLYKEVTYKQEGSTLEEAKQSPPQPVEIYEVTELFQFNQHKWSSD